MGFNLNLLGNMCPALVTFLLLLSLFGSQVVPWQEQKFLKDMLTKDSGLHKFPGSCSCGKPPRQIRGKQNRISGGSEAQANQFPWLVRIVGGCPQGVCGGTLISDNKRLAVLGQHEIDRFLISRGVYYTIPII